MATVTLNRTTHVLRADLTIVEFAILDAMIQNGGAVRIEQAISYIVQQQIHERMEKRKARLRDFVEQAPEDKIDALTTVIDAP